MSDHYDKSSLKILVADDSKDDGQRIQKVLASGGYKKLKLVSKIDSLKQLDGYDVAILDVVWPPTCRPQGESSDHFGIVGLRYLRLNSPNTIIILMSGHFFDLSQLDSIVEADGIANSNLKCNP